MRFWERPAKDMVREMEFDDEGKPITKMRIKLFINKGKIDNYVVQLEHLMDSNWKQVVRFNYYHGFAHKDVYNKNGEQARKVDSGIFSDLKDAVDMAITDISRNYKEYIRKFKEGV